KYKPLFAALVTDLDNRVNLNVHGNIRGRDSNRQKIFVANQGLGPWTVDISQAWKMNRMDPNDPIDAEWRNVLQGATLQANDTYTAPLHPGRYGVARFEPTGVDPTDPTTGYPPAPHKHGPIDYDESVTSTTVPNGPPTQLVTPEN